MSDKPSLGGVPPSPRSLVTLLRGAPWPATKDELIDYAARMEAPLQLLEELFSLPDDDVTYDEIETVLARPRGGEA